MFILQVIINSEIHKKCNPKCEGFREQTDEGERLKVEEGDGSGESHVFIVSVLWGS